MEELKKILTKYNLSLKKAFGQNFLTDNKLLDEIVDKAGVSCDDTILEIGCGAGALTTALAKKAKKVVGYEIDCRLKPVLSEVLQDFNNVEIVFSDVMKEKLTEIEKKLGDEYLLVANLPYYITTPIIMRFLENAKKLKAMVIMVQEEVAERLASKENSSDYGAITVGINLRGNAKIVMRVGREKFTPPPNVDSAIVKIDLDDSKFNDVNFDLVRNLVRCAFSNRRKMLINNVINTYKLSRLESETIFNSVGIPLTARGENLSAEDFVKLTNALEKR